MRRITPVFAVTGLVMGLATVLAAAELFRGGFHLAGLGVLLMGFVAGVQVWKQQATISILHGVRQRVAHLSIAVANLTPAATPPPAPTPGLPSSASADQKNGDPTSKLREIGVWTPPKTSYSSTHGRIAASVVSDPDAPFRLFAATNGFGSPDVTNVSQRSIALVGSDALAERLSTHFTVQRLHPRLSAAELEHARPTTFVVEEDALGGGPWAGALQPHGSALLIELRTAQAWIRRNAGINYVLPARRGAHIASPALRADTVVVQEPLLNEETGRTTLIDILLEQSPPRHRP